MTIMITEVYSAFRKAGIGDEESRHAAEAMAIFQPELLELKGKVNLLLWMMGVNLAFTMTMVWKLFIN